MPIRMFMYDVTNHECAVNAASAQVRSVLGEVDVAQPLHHPMVRPEYHFAGTILKNFLRNFQQSKIDDTFKNLMHFGESVGKIEISKQKKNRKNKKEQIFIKSTPLH